MCFYYILSIYFNGKVKEPRFANFRLITTNLIISYGVKYNNICLTFSFLLKLFQLLQMCTFYIFSFFPPIVGASNISMVEDVHQFYFYDSVDFKTV